MPHILVTNDDGVQAPGLLALVNAMRTLGDVTVFAPDRNWSASGHVKTLHRPLRVNTVALSDGTEAFATDGAPSDCVALAVLGLVKPPIDLVVSGVNTNYNLGHDVTYSGTVTAAMEAAIWHIPAIAFSTEAARGVGYGPSAQAALHIATRVLTEGLPAYTLLNVNIPAIAEPLGYVVTRQGLRVYRDQLDARTDPQGRPYYWIGGEPPSGVEAPGTDYGEVMRGYVSITPLHLDLTAHALLPEVQGWQFEMG